MRRLPPGQEVGDELRGGRGQVQALHRVAGCEHDVLDPLRAADDR